MAMSLFNEKMFYLSRRIFVKRPCPLHTYTKLIDKGPSLRLFTGSGTDLFVWILLQTPRIVILHPISQRPILLDTITKVCFLQSFNHQWT
ncbi:hypothetical protein ATG71_4694 [Bacillus sp. es.034]|nr:hypothetical protein ATG71_4694 [Bacillus sp. es.034]